MKQEISRHALAYFILVLGIVIFVFLFLGAWPNRWIQRMIIIGMTVFYFLWGILTHFKTKTITKEVAYEYGSVAFLAAMVLFLITL
jgi:hypothetical protein